MASRKEPPFSSNAEAGIIALLVLLIVVVGLAIYTDTADDKNLVTGTKIGLFGGALGVLATIVGFYFVYHAYQAQRIQADFALLNKLYEDLLNDINSIQYRKRDKPSSEGVLFQGLDAIYNYSADDFVNQSSVLNHLNLTMLSAKYLIKSIQDADFADESVRKMMLDKAYMLWNAKFFWPVYQGIYVKDRFQLLQSWWGNAPIFFFEFEQFSADMFIYLINEKILVLPPEDVDKYEDIRRMIADRKAKKYAGWEDRWTKEELTPEKQSFRRRLRGRAGKWARKNCPTLMHVWYTLSK